MKFRLLKPFIRINQVVKIEKDNISIYIPLSLIETIDKRSKEYYLSRSKQIQVDLLNYYKQIGYIETENKRNE